MAGRTRKQRGRRSAHIFALLLAIHADVNGWTSRVIRIRNLFPWTSRQLRRTIRGCQQQQQKQPVGQNCRTLFPPRDIFELKSSKNDDDESSSEQEATASHQQLEDDIHRRLSISRYRAISALSQPTDNDVKNRTRRRNDFQNKGRTTKQRSTSNSTFDKFAPSEEGKEVDDAATSRDSPSRVKRNRKRFHHSKGTSEFPRAPPGGNSISGGSRRHHHQSSWKGKPNRSNNTNKRIAARDPSAMSSRQQQQQQQQQQPGPRRQRRFNASSETATYSSLLPPPLTWSSAGSSNDPLSSGLSSWEEFLGFSGDGSSPSPPESGTATSNSTSTGTNGSTGRRSKASQECPTTGDAVEEAGVLPDRLPSINDLFPPDLSSVSSPSASPAGFSSSSPYSRRSTQPQQQPLEGVLPVSDLFYRQPAKESHDDEELPFSAEQSDSLTSKNNKINIRRNLANHPKKTSKQEMAKSGTSGSGRKKSGRRMVRRGMEMLVGGVPINADPPQRSVELHYDSSLSPEEWASVISLNTRDFGPLLHTSTSDFVTDIERGLFCEHFCYSTLKWDICPKDLREIVKSRNLQLAQSRGATSGRWDSEKGQSYQVETRAEVIDIADASALALESPTHDKEDDEYNEAMSIQVRSRESLSSESCKLIDEEKTKELSQYRGKGFGKNLNGSALLEEGNQEEKLFFEAKTELMFEVSVSTQELESGEGLAKGEAFKSVLRGAFLDVAGSECNGFEVGISKLVLTDKGDGSTSVDVDFAITNDFSMTKTHVQSRLKRISAAFVQAVDDGEMQISIAAAARLQTRWSDEVRKRVVEECLFDEDEDDESDAQVDEILDDSATEAIINTASPHTQHILLPKDDLFMGAGLDGIFPDYSEPNALNSPYRGEIGLRLVDAVAMKAKDRSPKVIAIGDVHGCIDELQDLLRQCDYRPGDLVVFLGDLVCKGPDSISVVQMAREIGAIGVRGNHDFEVIRWHQAIKSGVDPPVVGSEHFHIASCLSKSDMKWMYNLPWFISSKELGALFVHAGFVSGIRLAKQNPRLMMNMRSILPDGTVTSKFFNNWPWARLWDGPQTVLFGHDADRGLQQYENAVGLDTGCVYGGRLTACILPEKRLVSVSARREYFKYRRKHYD